MKPTILIGALIVVLIGMTLIITNQTNPKNTTTGEVHHSGPSGLNEPSVVDHSVHNMIAITSEKTFMEHMIPHHQEAIDTAKQVLARGGTTEEIKTLAQNIITAQEKEVTDMKMWYQAWLAMPYVDQGTYMPMMRDLSALSGVELDRVFLQDMIMHHEGAIAAAEEVVPNIVNPEIQALVDAIKTTQRQEIEAMNRMLLAL